MGEEGKLFLPNGCLDVFLGILHAVMQEQVVQKRMLIGGSSMYVKRFIFCLSFTTERALHRDRARERLISENATHF